MDTADKEQSMFLNDVLDHLGYDQENIEYRKSLHHRIGENFNKIGPSYTKYYVVGSASEGICIFCEGDYDCIVVNEHAVCVPESNTSGVDGNLVIYKCEDTEDTTPGYIRLKLAPEFTQAAFEKNNEFHNSTFGGYLHSTFYKSKMKMKELIPTYPVGSMYGFVKFRKVKTDFPLVYKMDIQAELENRGSAFGWPSLDIIKQVGNADVPSYVYPIGNQQSDSPYLEWRISHTGVEQILMDSMNDTLIKIYILLKLIVKPALGREAGMSSYILKNLLFWMCQAVPMKYFRTEHLVHYLVHAIGMLYNCVKNGHMPCFLIPERNLFPPLTVNTKLIWLHTLSVLREERARMVLNNDKLREVMIIKVTQPDRLLEYGHHRERIERLLLTFIKIKAETLAECKNKNKRLLNKAENGDLEKVRDNLYDTILPDWRNLSAENVSAIVRSHLIELLS